MDCEYNLAVQSSLKSLRKDLINDMGIIKVDLNKLNHNRPVSISIILHTDDIDNEIQQRQERAKNVIVYNLPESNSTDI